MIEMGCELLAFSLVYRTADTPLKLLLLSHRCECSVCLVLCFIMQALMKAMDTKYAIMQILYVYSKTHT